MKEEYYKEYFYFEEKNWWFRSRWKIISFFLRKYSNCKISTKILDVGTGTGKTFELLNQYGNVTGIDISKEAIKFCQQRGITNVIKGDAQSIPFKDLSFNLICAMDIIEHLDLETVTIRDFHRVLCKNGILLLTVPAFMFLWGRHDEINIHKKRYTVEEILSLLRTSGFKIEKLTYFNFLLFPVILLIRVGKRVLRIKEKELKSDFRNYPFCVNLFLEKIFSFEKFLLKYINFPFGVSILCIARKRENE